MNMIVTVIRVNRGNLLVRDSDSFDEVLVHYRNATRFSVGDHVRIAHDGKMTRSIPPQISAISVQRIRQQNPPTELRATVTRKGPGFLMVRCTNDNRQFRINFAHAKYFCVGQQIIIRHNTIVMNNPPEINATDITPVC